MRLFPPAHRVRARSRERQAHGDGQQSERKFISTLACKPVLEVDERDSAHHIKREQEADDVDRDPEENQNPAADLHDRRVGRRKCRERDAGGGEEAGGPGKPGDFRKPMCQHDRAKHQAKHKESQIEVYRNNAAHVRSNRGGRKDRIDRDMLTRARLGRQPPVAHSRTHLPSTYPMRFLARAPATPSSRTYEIHEVAELTGLAAPRLRAWERRYEVVRPRRMPNGYRVYTGDQVTLLRAFARLIADGERIGDLAACSREEVLARASSRKLDGSPHGALLEPIRELDRDRLELLVAEQLSLRGLQGFAMDVALPLARSIGDLWAQGELSVAAEHLATEVVVHTLKSGLRLPRAASRVRVSPRRAP